MAEAAIGRQLQKTFKAYNPTLEKFKEILAACESPLHNVSNLSEQYSCCSRVDFNRTALREFPDVQERLLAKIQLLLEEHMKTLHQALSELESQSSQIAKLHENTMDLYRRYGDQLDMVTMTKTPVMWPSLAQMLEFTQNADDLFHMAYLKRLKSVQDIDYADPDSVQKAASVWSNIADLEEKVKYILAHVRHFMGEKF